MSYFLGKSERTWQGVVVGDDQTMALLSVEQDVEYPYWDADIYLLDIPFLPSRFQGLGDSTSDALCPDVLKRAIYHWEAVSPLLNPAGKSYEFWYVIRGVTKDSAGAPLSFCEVDLFRSSDDCRIDTQVSDADGNYQVFTPYLTEAHYCTAYKSTGDVAGMTVKTLIPVAP